MTRRVALLLLLLATGLVGQNVKVRAYVQPAEAVRGQRIRYVVEVDVVATREEELFEPERPKPPLAPGYELEFLDAQRSSGSQTFIQGGRVQRTLEVSTRFVYRLIPTDVGRVELPAFEYALQGRTYRVHACFLDVAEEAPGNAFIHLNVSAEPKRPYVNQAVTLTYELRLDRPILGRPYPSLTIPWANTPNGFFAPPLQPTRRGASTFHVRLNDAPWDMSYQRDQKGEFLLFERKVWPLAEGAIELDACGAEVDVATKVENDRFGRKRATEVKKAIVFGEPMRLEVRGPSPVGRPPSFSGLVGDFEVTAGLGKTSVRPGDGVTLTLTIAGEGDIESVPIPSLGELAGFDVYPPDRAVEEEDGRRAMVVSWLIVPRVKEVVDGTAIPESGALPAVEFSWFAPTSESYRTAVVGPADIAFIEGSVAETEIFGGVESIGRTDDVEILSEGMRPIKTRPGSLREGGPGRPLWAVLIVFLAPVVGWAGLTRWIARRRRLAGDVGAQRQKRASREAEARLQEARALLDDTGRDFFGKATRCLTGFIGDKLGVPAASVSSATADELLARGGVDAAARGDVVSLLDELDGRRFGASDADRPEREATLRRLEELVRTLDRGLKKSRGAPRAPIVFAALLLAAGAASAQGDVSSEQLFYRGNDRFEARDWDGAIEAYRTAIDAGFRGPGLHYNLACAHLRRGDVGHAVHQLRLAKRLAPRDGDVAKNLAIARERAGAGKKRAERPLFLRIALWPHEKTTFGEIFLVFAVAWVLAWGLLVVKRVTGSLWPGLLAALLLFIAACAGLSLVARTLAPDDSREAVILSDGTEVFTGPSDTAYSVHFKLDAGAEVDVLEIEGAWVKVAVDGNRRGFVPRSSVGLL